MEYIFLVIIIIVVIVAAWHLQRQLDAVMFDYYAEMEKLFAEEGTLGGSLAENVIEESAGSDAIVVIELILGVIAVVVLLCLMLFLVKEKIMELEEEESGNIEDSVFPKEQSFEKNYNMEGFAEDGEGILRRLGNYRDLIRDEGLRDDLNKLKKVLKKIFELIEEEPQKAEKVRKLFHYYLPTIEKMLHQYREFEFVGIETAEVKEAEKQIKQTVRKSEKAFQKLCGDLMKEEAFDIETDAEVMETMLSSDGLLQSDLLIKE